MLELAFPLRPSTSQPPGRFDAADEFDNEHKPLFGRKSTSSVPLTAFPSGRLLPLDSSKSFNRQSTTPAISQYASKKLKAEGGMDRNEHRLSNISHRVSRISNITTGTSSSYTTVTGGFKFPSVSNFFPGKKEDDPVGNITETFKSIREQLVMKQHEHKHRDQDSGQGSGGLAAGKSLVTAGKQKGQGGAKKFGIDQHSEQAVGMKFGRPNNKPLFTKLAQAGQMPVKPSASGRAQKGPPAKSPPPKSVERDAKPQKNAPPPQTNTSANVKPSSTNTKAPTKTKPPSTVQAPAKSNDTTVKAPVKSSDANATRARPPKPQNDDAQRPKPPKPPTNHATALQAPTGGTAIGSRPTTPNRRASLMPSVAPPGASRPSFSGMPLNTPATSQMRRPSAASPLPPPDGLFPHTHMPPHTSTVHTKFWIDQIRL